MSAINSIGSDASLLTNNQTSTVQQTDSTSSSKSASSTSDNTVNQDKLEISSRAQKIQQLNEDFFSNGIKAFTITQDFIQRLEEYGFLTASEASNLGTNVATSVTSDTSTVGEISKFIDSYVESTKEAAPNSSLIDVLQQAKTVLDNFNNPTESSKSINIVQVSSQIQNYIDTSTEQLADSDKKSLKQLVSALDITNILTPGKNTLSQINSYLDIKKL